MGMCIQCSWIGKLESVEDCEHAETTMTTASTFVPEEAEPTKKEKKNGSA